MNKTAIKNFAIQSRKDLILGVSQKAFELGVTKDKIESNTITSSDAFVVHSKVLSRTQQKQRDDLLYQIKHKGYDQVIEEVAYTWFNRFIALRYMEVNGYLPSKIRVFSNHENKFKPEILDQALHISFEGVQKEKVIEYLDKSDDEGLYQYLLIAQCNDMNQYLPEMFEKIGNYTEILLPDGLLKSSGVLANMVESIAEEDFQDQVEIIGWLYQYYNSEVKDKVINIYKGVVKKNDIPAATQLFTTDWVVRYMIDNSLGKYWIERNPNSPLISKLNYYMPYDPVVINEEVQPIDLKVFDPCMGSGHILVYAFDVLLEIYVERGYTTREAANLIVKHNLYGLDIDERAFQLAYFAVMMKARKYNRRILEENISNNLSSIVESDAIERFEDFANQLNLDSIAIKEANDLTSLFKNAKEYGSLIDVKGINLSIIEELIGKHDDVQNDLFLSSWKDSTYRTLKQLLKQAKILSNQYQAVVTNPPYLNKMDAKLKTYVQKHYKEYSTDLFSVFMYRNFGFCTQDGYSAFMTPFVWMFIKSYEKLRDYLILNKDITSLIQMEYSAFEEATVPICTVVFKNDKTDQKGVYIKLSEFKGGMNIQNKKVLEALNSKQATYLYKQNSDNFSKIPGSPIAYWVSKKISNAFEEGELLGDMASPKQGLATGFNNLFLRQWFEPNLDKISFNTVSYDEKVNSSFKWFPYNKGGFFRKWYGNNDFVINWGNNGVSVRNFSGSVIRNPNFYFKKCISWSKISSGGIAFRFKDNGHIFDVAGTSIFSNEDDRKFLLGFSNSIVAQNILNAISPTLNYEVGHISSLPIIKNDGLKSQIDLVVEENISISKTDWDSFETSWDFDKHFLLRYYDDNDNSTEQLISNSYKSWKEFTNQQFFQLKENEEKLNKIFIDIYGLQDELTPEVEEKDITIHQIFDEKQDVPSSMKGSKYILLKEDVIKSFISYAIGCLFGRYSLDVDGLTYAGGDWDESKYQTIIPDDDNIIPISEEAYLEDDLLVRFITFIEVVYGSDTLEENLEFIASALNSKGNSSREVIREYLLNDFYKDHVKTYQKRPIYWLFDSGKNNGFKALIYMHRYNKDLLAKMRLDYVHELQERYRSERSHLTRIIDDIDNQRDKVIYSKQLEKLKAKEEELLRYEEKLHHLADQRIEIDLDDGVVVNYAKFEDLVAKVK